MGTGAAGGLCSQLGRLCGQLCSEGCPQGRTDLGGRWGPICIGGLGGGFTWGGQGLGCLHEAPRRGHS